MAAKHFDDAAWGGWQSVPKKGDVITVTKENGEQITGVVADLDWTLDSGVFTYRIKFEPYIERIEMTISKEAP